MRRPRDAAEIQSERLVKIVRLLRKRAALQKALDEIGLKPDDIRGIDDITKLPFTTKTDLRDTYPFGLFAVPREELTRIHASSGTTGKQTVVGYTANDVKVWATCAARSIVGIGGTKDDFVHVSYGYGLFTGGLGLHYGAEELGATAIPVSSGNTGGRCRFCRTTARYPLLHAVVCDVHRRDRARQGHRPREACALGRHLRCGAGTEEMRREIERLLDIKAYDIYGLSEIAGPVSLRMHGAERHAHQRGFLLSGGHRPRDGRALPDGEYGELVFTCIGKRGAAADPLPHARHLRAEPREMRAAARRRACAKPRGRTDDMLIIRGINVFLSQIESVLLDLGMDPNYQLIVDRQNNLDTLEVQVEMNESMFSGHGAQP